MYSLYMHVLHVDDGDIRTLYYPFQITCCTVGGFYDEYYRTHDALGYIGADRNATVAAASVYMPSSMFNFPQPSPQNYGQVGCHMDLCGLNHIISIYMYM